MQHRGKISLLLGEKIIAGEFCRKSILSYGVCSGPSRRGLGGKVTRGPATFKGPVVAQKYKVHQNAPFKKIIKGPRENVSSRRAVALNEPGFVLFVYPAWLNADGI